MSAMEFLRDVGKYFTVNAMLAKESVKRRIESEDGISYTEFSYSLLQAYDFLMLHDRFGCTLQIGGSDQWGNIVAGIDLIRRVRAAKAHGLVMPLLTTASGAKFGKTEGGRRVARSRRSRRRTSSISSGSTPTIATRLRYLKFFTFLDAGRDRGARGEQRPRAREAARATRARARGDAARARRHRGAGSGGRGGQAVPRRSLGDVGGGTAADLPQRPVLRSRAGGRRVAGHRSSSTAAGVASSKSEAVRLVKGGGISLNGRRLADEKERVTQAQAIEGRVFVIRKGKRDNFLVRLIVG